MRGAVPPEVTEELARSAGLPAAGRVRGPLSRRVRRLADRARHARPRLRDRARRPAGALQAAPARARGAAPELGGRERAVPAAPRGRRYSTPVTAARLLVVKHALVRPVVGAGGGGDVGVVAADGDRDVAEPGAPDVRRIERDGRDALGPLAGAGRGPRPRRACRPRRAGARRRSGPRGRRAARARACSGRSPGRRRRRRPTPRRPWSRPWSSPSRSGDGRGRAR